jgi:hypothetical protein
LGSVHVEHWGPLLFAVYARQRSLGTERDARDDLFAAFREGVLDAFISEGPEGQPFVKHVVATESSWRFTR